MLSECQINFDCIVFSETFQIYDLNLLSLNGFDSIYSEGRNKNMMGISYLLLVNLNGETKYWASVRYAKSVPGEGKYREAFIDHHLKILKYMLMNLKKADVLVVLNIRTLNIENTCSSSIIKINITDLRKILILISLPPVSKNI